MRYVIEDGQTWDLVAFLEKIEKEGKLGRFKLYDKITKLRCAVGVLEDWTANGPKNILPQSLENIAQINDDYMGTPEERCEHVARWLRKQIREGHKPTHRASYKREGEEVLVECEECGIGWYEHLGEVGND